MNINIGERIWIKHEKLIWVVGMHSGHDNLLKREKWIWVLDMDSGHNCVGGGFG